MHISSQSLKLKILRRYVIIYYSKQQQFLIQELNTQLIPLHLNNLHFSIKINASSIFLHPKQSNFWVEVSEYLNHLLK